jgi:hypothetical protein
MIGPLFLETGSVMRETGPAAQKMPRIAGHFVCIASYAASAS